MSGVNKVTLLGFLGKVPEFRCSPDGQYVCYLSLATSMRVKDVMGEWVDSTEWHRVMLFGRTALLARDHLKKGDQAYVEGRLHTRKWLDTETNEIRYLSEVIGESLELLGVRADMPVAGTAYTACHRTEGNHRIQPEAVALA